MTIVRNLQSYQRWNATYDRTGMKTTQEDSIVSSTVFFPDWKILHSFVSTADIEYKDRLWTIKNN